MEIVAALVFTAVGLFGLMFIIVHGLDHLP
jgi:hypothetical protein